MHVTSLHQQKYSVKEGMVLEYSLDKMSPDECLVKSVMEAASPEIKHRTFIESSVRDLAEIVPPIIKKSPKAVTSEQALLLTCRRRAMLDEAGSPIVKSRLDMEAMKELGVDVNDQRVKRGLPYFATHRRSFREISVEKLPLHQKPG